MNHFSTWLRTQFRLILGTLTIACCSSTQAADGQDWPEQLPFEVEEQPLLSAEEMQATLKVAKGWEVTLVAAEPLIEKPVVAEYDAHGRLWVAEMVTYMLDTAGSDEEQKISRVKRLEDTDGDGRMDKAVVVIDNILLPRVIAFDAVGIITTDGEALVRYPLDDAGDVSGDRTVLDAKYASGGNVEHQPNGFIPGIDNHRYNAKSAKAYSSGDYQSMSTSFRGQWGIGQTDDGMILTNNNSTLALADQFYPGTVDSKPKGRVKNGNMTVRIGSNSIRPPSHSRGTNRAYKWAGDKWVAGWGKNDTMNSPTSAGGMAFYDAAAMPDGFGSTIASTCVASNLVALRSWQAGEPYSKARNPLGNEELVTSSSERFRPVNTFTSPDGAINVVDMSHGIVQHDTYLTGYLRSYYVQAGLAAPPRGYGRIWKFTPKGRDIPMPASSPAEASQTELVEMLSHPVNWWRITAQYQLAQLPAEKLEPATLAALHKLLEKGAASEDRPTAIAGVHALRALQGMGKVSSKDIVAAVGAKQSPLRAHAYMVAATLPSLSLKATNALIAASPTTLAETTAQWNCLAHIAAPEAALKIAEVAKKVEKDQTKRFWLTAATLTSTSSNDRLRIATAAHDTWLAELIQPQKSAANGTDAGAKLEGEAAANFKAGKKHYILHCSGCHGIDGAGLDMMAPPLDGSNWVTGSKHQLASILLQGLPSGQITVSGEEYDFSDAMPALRDSRAVDDKQIAEILTYVRNAWSNEASPVETVDVILVRGNRTEADRLAAGVKENKALEYTVATVPPIKSPKAEEVSVDRPIKSNSGILLGILAATLFALIIFRLL